MPKEQFIITITVNADEDATDLKNAIDLACDRITSYDPSIEIVDSDIDYAPTGIYLDETKPEL